MNEKELRAAVQRLVLCELARTGQRCVPVMSSNRHVHLCQADVEKLFGAGYQLTKMRDLVQPGQFACNERVTIETEKGKMALRVVGPARKETQIELSFTDAVKLGLKPPIRMSGDLESSPGCTLTNGDRRVTIPRGVIVAERHLHLAPDEAEAFGVKDGDVVSLVVEGPRPGTLDGVIVRSGKGHLMEAHIDKDEANACALSDGQLCRVIRKEDAPAVSNKRDICASVPSAPPPPPPVPKRQTLLDLSAESRRLITEDDVCTAVRDGYKIIRYAPDAILTPLARDAASEKGVELVPVI